MILNHDVLAYVSKVVGKPVLCVFNRYEDKWYYFIADEFRPANPSNHIHENYLVGRDISGVLGSLGGFSHGMSHSGETAILAKVDDIQPIKYTFNDCRWVKITV